MAANPSIQLGTDGNWAIKEDNLLAYKKDGTRFFNKEFDFSRGSSATYVAKDGLIKTAGLQATNLVNNGDFSELGSELVTNGNFDTDSDWTKGTGWTIASNLANFNGLGFNAFRQNVGLITGKIYKVTFDLNITSGNVIFQLGGATNTFNSSATHTFYDTATANGVYSTFISLYSSTSSTFSIDNVSVKQVDPNDYWTLGTGWSFGNNKAVFTSGTSGILFQSNIVETGKLYKLTFDVIRTSGFITSVFLGGVSDNTDINESGSYTYYITSISQDVLGFNADSTFNGSITNISVQEIQTDTPRIDFSDSVKGALLLEPQSTNLVTYSEDLSQTNKVTNNGTNTVTNNYAISPDGTNTADRLVAYSQSGSSEYSLRGILHSTSVAESYTHSVWLKSNTGLNQNVIFYGRNFQGPQALCEVTNEWKRFDFTGSSNTSNYFAYLGTRPEYGSDNNIDILVWGIQLEQKSFATSYIPTYGSTATRNADVCNNSGSAQDFNSEEGVIYGEIAALVNDQTVRKISLSDGDGNPQATIGYDVVSNMIRCIVYDGTFPVDVALTTTSYDILNYHKIAIKYKSGDSALWVDGTEVVTSTNLFTITSPFNTLNFNDGNLGASVFYGKVKNLQVFKQTMSSGELYLLTTTQYQSYQEMATALNYTL